MTWILPGGEYHPIRREYGLAAGEQHTILRQGLIPANDLKSQNRGIMVHFWKRRTSSQHCEKMPHGRPSHSPLLKPFSALATPGMYLFSKYNEYKRQQQEQQKRKVTEKELENLNQKIVSTTFFSTPQPSLWQFYNIVSLKYHHAIDFCLSEPCRHSVRLLH